LNRLNLDPIFLITIDFVLSEPDADIRRRIVGGLEKQRCKKIRRGIVSGPGTLKLKLQLFG